MTHISSTVNSIAAGMARLGNVFKPASPVAARLTRTGNVQQGVKTPPARPGGRRAERSAGEPASRGNANPGNTPLSDMERQDAADGEATIGAGETPSSDSAAGRQWTSPLDSAAGRQSTSLIDPDDFRRNFNQDSLESLFAAAGKNKEKLKQLFNDSPNDIAKTRLTHIATACHLAAKTASTDTGKKALTEVMTRLTNKMVADGLGRKSIFGSHQPSKEDAYRYVKDLEQQLITVLKGNVGDGISKAGDDLLTREVEPFIAAYIEQQLDSRLSPETKANIKQYIDNVSLSQLGNLRRGVAEYQTDDIEKVFRDIELILRVPHLLRDLINNLLHSPPPGAEAAPPGARSVPEPEPEMNRPDNGGSRPAAGGPRNNAGNQGPPGAGNTYNNFVYSPNNSTYAPVNFTFSPTHLTINHGGQTPAVVRPFPGRADASTATEPTPTRSSVFNGHTAGVGQRPVNADGAPPDASGSLLTELVSARVIPPQPIARAVLKFTAPLGPSQEPAGPQPGTARTAAPLPGAGQTAATGPQAAGLFTAASVPAMQLPSAVLSNQGRQLAQHPRRQPAVNHFVPLNQPPEALATARERLKTGGPGPLSPRLFTGDGDNGTRRSASGNDPAGIRRSAPGNGGNVPAAAALADNPAEKGIAHDRAAAADKPAAKDIAHDRADAPRAHPGVTQTAQGAPSAQVPSSGIMQPQPVVLSNQGKRLAQHPRRQPAVNHFVPLNQPPGALATARERLKTGGPGPLSPRLFTGDGDNGTRRSAPGNDPSGILRTAPGNGGNVPAGIRQAASGNGDNVPAGAAVADKPAAKDIAHGRAGAPRAYPGATQAAATVEPVVLSNQGVRLPRQQRVQPGVNHFAPLNQPPEPTETARERLNTGGPGYLSPRLAAFRPRGGDNEENEGS